MCRANTQRVERGRRDAQRRPMVVLDFETTGLQVADRVIEVAAIRVDGKDECEFNRLCNPGRLLPPSISRLTNLTNADLCEAPLTGVVIRDLRSSLLSDRPILVAHNAAFELRMLNLELGRAGLPPFRGGVLCTMQASRWLYPEVGDYRLSAMTQWLNIPAERGHRALDDAKATQRLLYVLIHESRRVGLDLLEMAVRHVGVAAQRRR